MTGRGKLVRRVARATLLYFAVCAVLTLGSANLTRDCSVVQKRYDTAVVLGGGKESQRRVQTAQSGRIHSAIFLYNRGKFEKLHLTGGGPDGLSSNGRLLAEIALAADIPKSVISVENDSLSTLQNALLSKPFLDPDHEILVITEGFHAWRAWASFAWSGRPGDVCASQLPGRLPYQKALTLGRETAAWAVNVPRAAVWTLASLVGLERHLPELWLV